MDDKILKIVYTFFLGLMLSLFVGMGISTFYPAPKPPSYDMPYKVTPANDDQAQYDKMIAEQQAYDKSFQQYNRNVSVISLVAAVLLLAASLAFEKRNQVIANGILLGGLFTLLYSIGRGLNGQDSRYTFIAVTVGLIVAVYLGYRRFSQLDAKPASKKKRR